MYCSKSLRDTFKLDKVDFYCMCFCLRFLNEQNKFLYRTLFRSSSILLHCPYKKGSYVEK